MASFGSPAASAATVRVAALIVLIAFGLVCGSVQIPLQHKLLGIAGPRGPLALSLVSSAVYLGAAIGSGLGSVTLNIISSARFLPLLPAGAGVIALLLSQYRRNTRTSPPATMKQPAGSTHES